MGAVSEKDWSIRFSKLFDKVFGANHLSLSCIFKSSVASLISVFAIWYMMNFLGIISDRARKEISLTEAIALGLAINVLADYISLLETRYIIGKLRLLKKIRHHVLALMLDALLTAGIITSFIFVFRSYLVVNPDGGSIGELLGAFSIYSIFFYSTFVTSIWTWMHVLSIFTLKAFTSGGLSYYLDVKKRPAVMLSLSLSIWVFAICLLFALFSSPGKDKISFLDRALCYLTPSQVCGHLSRLSAEAASDDFLLKSCSFGHSLPCFERGVELLNADEVLAVSFLERACTKGVNDSCELLIEVYQNGLKSVEENWTKAYTRARLLCERGVTYYCPRPSLKGGMELLLSQLDPIYDPNLSSDQVERGSRDTIEIIPFTEDMLSMPFSYIGDIILGNASDEENTRSKASRLYNKCRDGDAVQCFLLGNFFDERLDIERNYAIAGEFYKLSCVLGFAPSCEWN